MTRFPDFTKLDLGSLSGGTSPARPRSLATPEGIDLATAYSAADTKGLDFLPDGIPVAGLIGDQQGALFGQACFQRGMAPFG